MRCTADLILTDMNGKIQRQWREQDFTHSRTSVADIAPGVYLLQIRQAGKVGSYKLLKM